MATTTAVTIRLDESQLKWVDRMVKHMRGQKFAAQVGRGPTRSDAVRFFITGWLMDHGETLDKMLDEGERP